MPHTACRSGAVGAAVHIMRGDRQVTHDLTRAAIEHAAAVVVLNGRSPTVHNGQLSEGTLAAMDAQVILATLEAEKRCSPTTAIMSEVHNGLFSKNLGVRDKLAHHRARAVMDDDEGAGGATTLNDRHMHNVMQQMDPGYAGGRILLTDYCDKLVSQAFFNPHILPLLNALLNPSMHNLSCATVASCVDYRQHARSAGLMSGHVRQIAVPAEFVAAAQLNELGEDTKASEPFYRRLSGGRRRQEESDEALEQRVSMTWGHLFEWLRVRHSAIAFGIYVNNPDAGARGPTGRGGAGPWSLDGLESGAADRSAGSNGSGGEPRVHRRRSSSRAITFLRRHFSSVGALRSSLRGTASPRGRRPAGGDGLAGSSTTGSQDAPRGLSRLSCRLSQRRSTAGSGGEMEEGDPRMPSHRPNCVSTNLWLRVSAPRRTPDAVTPMVSLQRFPSPLLPSVPDVSPASGAGGAGASGEGAPEADGAGKTPRRRSLRKSIYQRMKAARDRDSGRAHPSVVAANSGAWNAYVITHPPAEQPVRPHDSVYVLIPPDLLEAGELEVLDMLRPKEQSAKRVKRLVESEYDHRRTHAGPGSDGAAGVRVAARGRSSPPPPDLAVPAFCKPSPLAAAAAAASELPPACTAGRRAASSDGRLSAPRGDEDVTSLRAEVQQLRAALQAERQRGDALHQLLAAGD
jgi:hypothetical protein